MSSPTSPQVNQGKPSTSQASQQGSNYGGGDLLGFGNETASPSSTHSQPPPQQQQQNSGGFDLMGFGSGPSQPQQPQQQNNNNNFGFDFGGSSQPQNNAPPPSNIQKTNSTGGFSFDSTPAPQQGQKTQSTAGFTPITNTNPNKVMGYENQHLQIWFDCIS